LNQPVPYEPRRFQSAVPYYERYRLGYPERLIARVVALLGLKQGDAVLDLWRMVTLRGWQILHLAGRDQADWVRAGYRELGLAARVIDFTPAMADVWSVADLAISRSGASSCAELTACGVPSILMPYPFHKDMHQHPRCPPHAPVRPLV